MALSLYNMFCDHKILILNVLSKFLMNMASDSLSYSLTTSRADLQNNGRLLWRGVTFKDFKKLGVQKKLQVLDISNSEIESLITMQPQPLLREIIADNSMLSSFAGISRHPRLSSFSFKGTPLYHVENSRMAAIVAIGPHVITINGKPVTKKERRIAETYPPIARNLIESGWVLQSPPPNIYDFQFLADEFGIDVKREELEARRDHHINDRLEPPEHSAASILSEELLDISFAEDVARLLRPLGFAIRHGSGKGRDVVRAVSSIVDSLIAVERVHNIPHE